MKKVYFKTIFPLRVFGIVFLLLGISSSLYGSSNKIFKKSDIQVAKNFLGQLGRFLDGIALSEDQGYTDVLSEQAFLDGRFFLKKENEVQSQVLSKMFPQEVFSGIKKVFENNKKKPQSLFKTKLEIRKRLNEINFDKLGPMRMLFDDENGIKLNALNDKSPHLLHLIEGRQVFQNYYKKLNPKYKIKVLQSIIGVYESLPDETIDAYDLNSKILSKMFQAGGPIIQKILQRVNDALGVSGMTPFVREVLKEVLVDINPFSDEDAKKIIMARLPEGGIFRDKESLSLTRRLGAASIGQTHIMKLGNTNYVVKFTKPGVKDFVGYEAELLKEIISGKDSEPSANDAILNNLVDNLAFNVYEEVDLRNEENNLARAHKTYNKDKVRAVDLPARTNSEGVMIMSMAPGKDVDRSYNELRSAKSPDDLIVFSGSMQNFYRSFVQNSLFGDGFFHGDPHRGNIFYDRVKKLLTLIDFGNAHTLNKKQQKAMISLIEGVSGEDDEIDQETVSFAVKTLLGIEDPLKADMELTEIVDDILTNCVFYDTDDAQLLTLIEKWKNGRNTVYKKYTRILDSTKAMCLDNLSHASKTKMKMVTSDSADDRLKILLNFLNNVALGVPESVNSFLNAKCMVEDQIRVINSSLAQKEVENEHIVRPEDIFQGVLDENLVNEDDE